MPNNKQPQGQMERKVLREQKLWDALYRISHYQQPEHLRKFAERDWGLSENEAVDMAYENVIQEAKNAIRGSRRPKSVPAGNESQAQAPVSPTSSAAVGEPEKKETK